MQLTTDNRDDVRRANLATALQPTWPDVEAAIRRLDGKHHTEVLLAIAEDGPYISVGGGPERYFVFIWTNDERNLILSGEDLPAESIRLVVGGQSSNYPSNRVVGLDRALVAARSYFETQEADPTLKWEAD